MQIKSSIDELRASLAPLRGQRIALVPTMGNLHAGHISLVEYAHQQADMVMVSIFVNPLQFGPNEDFDHYPRTLEADAALLEPAGTDYVFAPQVKDLYPNGRDHTTVVQVPELNALLCGTARPGHFDGVSSVVARLFNAVQPDVAIFGKKDYQQLLVLKRMTEELLMPIDIIGLSTFREKDGLAMSSRNAYMTAKERQQAPHIYQTLQSMTQAIRAGRQDFTVLEQEHAARLSQLGFKPDYVAVRRKADLQPAQSGDQPEVLVVLIAAHLGKARLIDNLEVVEDLLEANDER